MSKLVLNVKYLLLLSFLSEAEFYNLGHSQGITSSAVFSEGAGGARAPPEFGSLEKGRSLISAYRSLAITTNTPWI